MFFICYLLFLTLLKYIINILRNLNFLYKKYIKKSKESYCFL